LNVKHSTTGTMPWANLLSVVLVSAAVGAWGCSKCASVAEHCQTDEHSLCHEEHGETNECHAQLAKLSDEDRKLAEAQGVCVVNPNNSLGCKGVPYKLTIEGRPVFLCCEHCQEVALRDPQATLAKVDGLLEKHSANLHKNTK
jgi:hypothetical protein